MFKTRVITAAILLPLFVGGIFFLDPIWWSAALIPLVLAGAWEWATLVKLQGIARWGYCALVVATGTGILSMAYSFDAPEAIHRVLWISVLFWIFCVPIWLWRKWSIGHVLLSLAAGWILLVPTWIALVILQRVPWILLAVLGIVWVADSAAYFAGRKWGRRKLAPAISPGKTWEGVFGAGIAVAVYHALVWNFGLGKFAPESGAYAIALVAVLFPLSIAGDLFESLVKRQAGVKDSGRLLPGHGGVLDRIDALTSTLPLAAVLVPMMMPRL